MTHRIPLPRLLAIAITPLMVMAMALEGSARSADASSTTAPATLSGLSSDEVGILHRLETGTWHDRKIAEAELAARGPDDEPVARAMLAKTTDPEAEARLDAVLALWAQERLIGPSLITLHLHHAPAKQAFAELFRQASASFMPEPANLFDSVAPVSIDVDRQPFWVAMQKLSHLTNVGLSKSIDGTCRLSRGNIVAGGPQVIDGQFLIVACGAQQLALPGNGGKVAQVGLQVYPEPKTYVLVSSASITLDNATDNRGNVLSQAPQAIGGFRSPFIELGPIFEELQLPEKNPGNAVEDLRATIRVEVAYDVKHVDIDDITHAGSQVLDPKGGAVTFLKCDGVDQTYQVSFQYQTSRMNLYSECAENPRARVHLLDASGKELSSNGLSASFGPASCSLIFSFSELDPTNPKGTPLVPKRMIWDLPSGIRQTELPVNFKNMNLKIVQ